MSMSYLSRIEDILEAKINGTAYTEPPQSRIEELLIQLNVGGGGGGDNPDLTSLTNRVSQLETKVNNQGDTITGISGSIDSMQSDIQNLGQNIDQIANYFETHAIMDNVPEETDTSEEGT